MNRVIITLGLVVCPLLCAEVHFYHRLLHGFCSTSERWSLDVSSESGELEGEGKVSRCNRGQSVPLQVHTH